MISNNEVSSSVDRKLSDIYDRNERIDELVIIAKQEFDKNKSYRDIIQKLSSEMLYHWSLTPVTQRGYLNVIRTKFENVYGIRLQSDGSINSTEIDNEIINGKPEKKLSINNLFRTTLQNLEGKDADPVKRNVLSNALVRTGRFTLIEAENLIEKMQKQSVIYESKPDHYNLV